jgi:hypothetical protein
VQLALACPGLGFPRDWAVAQVHPVVVSVKVTLGVGEEGAMVEPFVVVTVAV